MKRLEEYTYRQVEVIGSRFGNFLLTIFVAFAALGFAFSFTTYKWWAGCFLVISCVACILEALWSMAIGRELMRRRLVSEIVKKLSKVTEVAR